MNERHDFCPACAARDACHAYFDRCGGGLDVHTDAVLDPAGRPLPVLPITQWAWKGVEHGPRCT